MKADVREKVSFLRTADSRLRALSEPMQLRHLLPTMAILCLAVRCAVGDERDAVIRLDGCTGFVVEDNLLVTAKHCRLPKTLQVSLQGQSVTARQVSASDSEDGPVLFHLEGGPYESLPVSAQRPELGDRVYSLGYPGGHWARIEGEIVGGNGQDTNYTNHRIATGNSGGPLLNERGEVIGVALSVAGDITVHRSGFAGWNVTTEAIRQAKQGRPTGRKRPLVVVFSSENCGPCRQLEADVRAGDFRDYEFVFVRWNETSGQWTRPDLYREFLRSCQPQNERLGFPTIWVRGTDRYRVGYTAGRRGGLLGWLAAAVTHLIEGVVGRPEPPLFPEPLPPPEPEDVPKRENTPVATPPQSAEPDPLLTQLLADVAALRDEALQTQADLDTFKESGVVGKIRAIARLKSDKDETLARVEAVKTDVDSIRSRFRERPLQFLWGLLGLVSGLIHRRFAH